MFYTHPALGLNYTVHNFYLSSALTSNQVFKAFKQQLGKILSMLPSLLGGVLEDLVLNYDLLFFLIYVLVF